MLAGAQEALHAGESLAVIGQVTAIDSLLAGLLDYAGLYPPASLDMRSAVENYLTYKRGKHAHALGRFIVDVHHINELRAVARNRLRDIRLSVIASVHWDMDLVSALTDASVPIEAVELKAASTAEIQRLAEGPNIEKYIEIPMGATSSGLLEIFAAAGARVKLRMGGVVAEAFPSAAAVAEMLAALHRHGLAFKATAGLHHPLRSRHPFTYAPDSPTGTMHGFINLFCAAALIHFGGNIAEATAILDEQDPGAWRLAPDAITWRSRKWSAEHIAEVRKQFIGIGSCSFEEPISELETLGWL
jgi:hypothetical protein